MIIGTAISSHPAIMLVLLAVYAGFAAADLFKRHLLSNKGIYEVTMLLAPIAALTAIGTPILSLFTRSIGTTALLFIGGTALLLLAAAVYIRGHIVPVDKSAGRYAASKRLIYFGTAGTAVYGVLIILQIMELLTLFNSMGKTVIESIQLLVVLVICLFIPIFNIIAFVILLFIGAEIAAVGIAAFLALLMNLLTANGCIRYIVTTDMTKGQKALRIFLSLIPIVNIVMGIRYCKNMKAYM